MRRDKAARRCLHLRSGLDFDFRSASPTSFAKGASPWPKRRRTTIDTGEVERFSALAAEWWNPNGKFRPLHKFNPVRLAYIRDQVAARFGRDPHAARPFEGLRFLDIGCGGGLLCEPMARLGAEVVGADASATNIEVAKLHAAEAGVTIDYRARHRRGACRRRREIRRDPQHGSGRARLRRRVCSSPNAPRW